MAYEPKGKTFEALVLIETIAAVARISNGKINKATVNAIIDGISKDEPNKPKKKK